MYELYACIHSKSVDEISAVAPSSLVLRSKETLDVGGGGGVVPSEIGHDFGEEEEGREGGVGAWREGGVV